MTAPRRVADVIMHPVRMQIIDQLAGRTMTTAQLREALPDVKQATLYRHVSALLDAEILTVVDERRVRGTTERTLALDAEMAHVDRDELQAMDRMQLRSAFVTFVSGLSAGFDDLLDHDDPELRNFLGFGRGPLYVDGDDLAHLQTSLNELLTPYLERRDDGQRRVSLATVLLPEVAPTDGAGSEPAQPTRSDSSSHRSSS